jgi:hypothetical protein
MKRFLAIIASLMLVLGFAASAFAIHAEIPSETQAVVAKGATQLTLGGELRMRGWYTDNITNTGAGVAYNNSEFTPNRSAAASWYDGRVRLSLQADVTKNTTGFVHLESNTGSSTTSDTYTWGSLNNKASGAGYADLAILEAWIQHKGSGLLGIPAGIKVGHMPLKLGEGQFLDLTKFGSDAIVFFMDPTKELHIGLLTAKVVGSAAGATADTDIDTYVALMTYKVDPKNTVGLNFTWINSADLTAIDGTVGAALGVDLQHATAGRVADVTNTGNRSSLNFQNLGIHANGNINGLMYKAEVDFQWGKITDVGAAAGLAPMEIKQKGLGIFAELAYKIDPVTIKAKYGYGSGDKAGTNTKIEEFQTIQGRDVHHAFIYEYIVDGAAENQLFPAGSTTKWRARGLANTSMYSLGLSFAPAKDLTIAVDGFIFRANKADDGVKYDAVGGTTPSKNIGSEIDARLTYKIDRNLTYSITAGYFSPGGYYEDAYTLTARGLTKKAVTAAQHALTLSF